MKVIAALALIVTSLTTALASPMALAKTTAIEKRQSFTGFATVYYQGGALGSCGVANPDSSLLASVSPAFGPNALCGRKIRITNTGPTTDNSIGGAGTTVEAVVADTCPGCDQGHLDLSVGAWNALTNRAYPSQVGISWSFI